MKVFLIFIFLLISYLPLAQASFEVGAGMTSATGGRVVPSLAGTLSYSDSAFSGFSTGVQSEIYYQSTYGINYYRIWNAGDFLGGKMQAGFGGGIFYSARGFRDTGRAITDKSSNFGLGPAIRMNWTPFSIFYVNLEGTFGLRELSSHINLNFQDMISFSIGLRIL